MFTNLKKRTEGFTIIEVLIVLAIAGLIMLIVFLAVPALQRNSRNTQRRNDVQASLGSMQEVINNNNGKLPATVAAGIANANYGFFDVAEFTGSTASAAAVTSVTSTDSGVVFQNYAKCGTVPAANTAAMPTAGAGATKRSVVAVYRVEVPAGYQVQCVDM
jgi:prepilin-type N-terminal cleavage/methylation domain-containing protein